MPDPVDALLAELGSPPEPGKQKKSAPRSRRQEELAEAFGMIEAFFARRGRAPDARSDDHEERLLAAALAGIRRSAAHMDLLRPMDQHGLIDGKAAKPPGGIAIEEMGDDALLAELGAETPPADSITRLRHVRPAAARRAAEAAARQAGDRQPCRDFAAFKPLFERVQAEIESGRRKTRPFKGKSEIERGNFLVLGGQKAYVAEKGEEFPNQWGETDARLRVIFDNGTESNMLMRSMYRAMHKEGATGRRISEPMAGPLFSDQPMQKDQASGIIYVLRSKSNEPFVRERRDLLHKIGVTSGSVERRITNAKMDPTFLMSDVEIVGSYELYNIDRGKLEKLLHKVFQDARANISIKDRFGRLVKPKEWFLVPLHAIDDLVGRIRTGAIEGLYYDSESASLKQAGQDDPAPAAPIIPE